MHQSGWFLAGPVAVLILGTLTASASVSAEPFALRDGDRIIFFGDSITQAGHYVVDLEAFLLTRFPDHRFTIRNHGISSETISGTSEPDHDPRRPNAHDRFHRDITAWHPDIVVACFGMNDGNYHPFDEDRFARFRDGVQRLIERVGEEAGARLVLLTPPPYDPYRRQVSDPIAIHYGYKFPAVDYDRTLGRYAQFLIEQEMGDEDLLVADVHSATNEHLRARRREQVSFSLAPDGVHPNPTGHWLIAQTLLSAWHAPALVAEAIVDLERQEVVQGDVSQLFIQGVEVHFTWKSPLPMPIDAHWDQRSINLEQITERFNRYRLTVKGLPDGKYRLYARLSNQDEESFVVEQHSEAMANGLDLTILADFPTVKIGQEVRSRLQAFRGAESADWRRAIADPNAVPPFRPQIEEPEELIAIRRLCQSKEILIRLVPLKAD